MSKILKKIGRIIYAIFESLFKTIDRFIIMPISRLVYNISKLFSSNNNKFNTLLNIPHFLLIISLIFAIICFVLVDRKVVSLVDTEAEVIEDVAVTVIYNEEAFVIENVPETIDIIISGRKSDIYLAKQLGEFEVTLDLSKYTEPGTYKVSFTATESIDTVDYILNPSYIVVTIEDKISDVFTVSADLINTDDLHKTLSVSSITLDSTEVIVKGSQDALDSIATIKALVSLADSEYKEAGTYEVTDIPLVAYDTNGNIIENVEIVPSTLSGTLVLSSYSQTVPLSISTTGDLVSGKAIASITINGNSSYSLDIYGEEDDIKSITSVPVTINVDGLGSESVKTYKVTLSKPSGVRYMSESNLTIKVTFGDEVQKTVTITDIEQKNLAEGYSASITSDKSTQVQVKGVQSNIDEVSASDINAYVDLSGLTEGTYDVPVKIENNNPLINYTVSNTITIVITKN